MSLKTTEARAASPGGPELQYFRKLASGAFEIQQCTACQTHIFPPRIFCTTCDSRDLAWVPASRRATVHSWTVIRRSEPEGGDYNVVLVDLAEGPRMMGTIVGASPQDLKIGAPLSGSLEGSEPETRVVWTLLPAKAAA